PLPRPRRPGRPPRLLPQRPHVLAHRLLGRRRGRRDDGPRHDPGPRRPLGIPDESPAHRTALVHLGVGVVILVLYLGAVAARWPAGSDDARFLPAVVVDVLGLLAITAQGWLGGELVYKHHVGVLTPSEGGDPVTLEARPAQGPSSARGGARRPGAERP